MKKTVIIVGAGASYAEALPSHPKRSMQPPLDLTFFDLCRSASYQGCNDIRDYMTKEFGIDPFVEERGMEEVFNYIYTDAFSSNPSKDCLSAYWALIGMYRTAIATTTNPLDGMSRSGVGHVLRTLLDHDSKREISFVTFNQDLVIEKAIENTVKMKKYSGVPWNLEEAYSSAFKRTVSMRLKGCPFIAKGEGSIKVLKLHGSLNWVYRVRSGTDPKNSLRKPSNDLICVNDKRILPKLTDRARGPERSRKVDVIPLIVPPIFEKSARYQEVLRPIWEDARKAVSHADELIVFGYSFPDADFSSKSMLRQSLHKNPNLQTLHVIDTNASTAGKIANIVPLESCHFYETAKVFREIYTKEN
jgi:hypothetical protein